MHTDTYTVCCVNRQPSTVNCQTKRSSEYVPKSIQKSKQVGFDGVHRYERPMISITPSTPKFRAINHPTPMITSNAIHSLPYRPILSTPNPQFRALKFTPKSPFPPTPRFRLPVIQHSFSTKVIFPPKNKNQSFPVFS